VYTLYEGCAWAEGPAWSPGWRSLVWSDIPNDRQLRWNESSGTVGVFRYPAGHTNGNTVDRQGRLLSCEHGGRRVSRTEFDGTVTTVAGSYNGKRLNSPNDVVVKSDDSIWFTDPAYGIESDYEGHRAEMEQDGCYVFRVDPASGELRIVADDFMRPNGLAFCPTESHLYISDTGATHGSDGLRHIRKFSDAGDGSLSGGEVFATCTAGFFDGFRVDVEGRVWTSTGEGVHVYDPDGTLIGKVLIPEVVANVEFGGPKLNHLFICGTTSLYTVKVMTNGVKRI
ncbi:MAG: SMP-30/gluconolactonase/LRE family protein, partial [Chloroflexia bacterium]|nr:SMP-30/gluconolactonase/LRE family protein [Chloroflexia bacterium]